ncbi:hypothetical protein [Paenibacillus guangzhouensis]|uniref:hypothetical protein n=1 Tax=Paenibacillus guangzhouensis TaxID=1473112 RepID=UPI0012675F0C|nr:hypothetical protein [Paenibacillus guangzhouensis]
MKLTIVDAVMEQREEGYYGSVQFTLEQHASLYEISLHSKRGIDWDYSLSFAKESGSEEELLAADALIEADDALFDQILDAAEEALAQA